MNIFISHIHEEAPLAIVFKKWIESSFSGLVNAYVSSDKTDLPAGDEWRHSIRTALKEAAVFITICSPNSIARPWIQFESGCAWIMGVPVMPICHSGLANNQLPGTMSNFQSLVLESNSFIDELIQSLVEHFELPKVPPIDSTKMHEELLKARQEIRWDGEIAPISVNTSVNESFEEIEIDLLVAISESGQRGLTLDQAAAKFNINSTKAAYYLENLREQRYIYKTSATIKTTAYYRLNNSGRKILVERDLV